MLKRIAGSLCLLLALATALAAVRAHQWRSTHDERIEKTGEISLGYEMGDQDVSDGPFTFAVVRGARRSHVKLARALDVAAAAGASPVVVLGHAVPDDALGRWRLARVIAEHDQGVAHLACPSHPADELDPLLYTTLATPEAFAFPAYGCTFRAGSESSDFGDDMGVATGGGPIFAFSCTGAEPVAGSVAATFASRSTDEEIPTVELVSVAADGSFSRRVIAVPAIARPVDAWRAFECSFLPLVESRLGLIGLLLGAVAVVALGMRLAVGRSAESGAARPAKRSAGSRPDAPLVPRREIQAALRVSRV